jgi:hypothetical protein
LSIPCISNLFFGIERLGYDEFSWNFDMPHEVDDLCWDQMSPNQQADAGKVIVASFLQGVALLADSPHYNPSRHRVDCFAAILGYDKNSWDQGEC